MITLCWVSLVILLSGVLCEEALPKGTEVEEKESFGVTGWIEDRAMGFLDSLILDDSPVEAREKKKKYNKYVLPLVIGFLLIKSILLPVALKSLAVLSGKAVILSLMSLILAAIVGLKKVAQGSEHHSSNYDVVNVPLGKYRRKDDYYRRDDIDDDDMPYRYYRD